jgi:radical SAM superfamily enzyme YgiQ (UPF0313 family)
MGYKNTMAKVLLIMPPLPQKMGSPYLGQQYLISNLLVHGHEVRALDMAASHWQGADTEVLNIVKNWVPDLIGMTLFTYNALAGYQLLARIGEVEALCVAGGPHVTACPEEPLRFGFDVSVVGEGERALVEILEHLTGNLSFTHIKGLALPTRNSNREVVGYERTVRREVDNCLDTLPYPHLSYPAYETEWYSGSATAVIPGGTTTSRGCPARCTFCANYVTGRVFRWRTTENVILELKDLRSLYGIRHFSFWDDAFTARRSRLNELCDALNETPELSGVTWSCITPGNMVKPRDLKRMSEAGCVAVNFGIESGSPEVLKQIQKGQRPQHVIDAVMSAKEEGMRTVVNLMFGFPGEGVAELEETFGLMERLSPYTDFFNNRGILVPFPGTPIYEQHWEAYGFGEWWLDETRIPAEPDYNRMDARESQNSLLTDPTLDVDFFHYSPAVKEMIAQCVRYKGLHNQRTMGLLPKVEKRQQQPLPGGAAQTDGESVFDNKMGI